LHIVPDWAVFASWDKYPGHAVTDENGPGEDYTLKQVLEQAPLTIRSPTPPQLVRRYELTTEGEKYLQQIPGTFG
jgi:hypothetical protein